MNTDTPNAEQQERVRGSALLGDFIFRHECTGWCGAYVVALRMLGETAKNQWTPEDVIDAVMRAESPDVQYTAGSAALPWSERGPKACGWWLWKARVGGIVRCLPVFDHFGLCTLAGSTHELRAVRIFAVLGWWAGPYESWEDALAAPPPTAPVSHLQEECPMSEPETTPTAGSTGLLKDLEAALTRLCSACDKLRLEEDSSDYHRLSLQVERLGALVSRRHNENSADNL